MKHLFYIIVVALLLSACKKDFKASFDDSKAKTLKDLKKIPNAVVDIKSNATNIEKLVKNNKESVIEFLRDSAWTNGKGKSLIYSTDEFIVPDNQLRLIYPGSLLKASGIPNLKYEPLASYQSKVKPITVSVSAPGKFVSGTITSPSASATRNFISSIFPQVYGKELAGFQFDMSSFTYYDELKLSFGANVNVGTMFNVGASYGKVKLENKTGLVAKFIQKNFTLDMDLPQNGELLHGVSASELGAFSPLYVSSITYGRLGVIKVESNYTYEELKRAFNIAFKVSVVNGSANIDSKTLEVIENSEILVKNIGGAGTEVVKTIKGFEEFKKYILSGGNYNEKAPGFPLYFTLSHLSDHSVYKTIFNIHLPK